VVEIDVDMVRVMLDMKKLNKEQSGLDEAYQKALANTTNPDERIQLTQEYMMYSDAIAQQQSGCVQTLEALSMARSHVLMGAGP